MSKRIHHMGMVVEAAKHEDFHKRAPILDAKQHRALMTRMGITPEEDEAWHKTHLTLGEQRAQGLKHVDTGAIGMSFAEFCVRRGRMVQKGKDYLITKDGIRQLRSQFDISVP